MPKNLEMFSKFFLFASLVTIPFILLTAVQIIQNRLLNSLSLLEGFKFTEKGHELKVVKNAILNYRTRWARSFAH